MISAFGAQLALLNAGSRLLFAAGRETSRPGSRNPLLRVSPRFRSPVGALTVVGVASLAGLLAFSFEPKATRAAALTIEYGAYLLVVVYLMTVVAALVWTWRGSRRPFPIAVLVIGVIVMAEVIVKTFHPFPEPPFNRVVIAAAGSALLGVAALFRPGLLRRLRGSQLLEVTTTRRAVGTPETGA
jgi:amino acid transporter